MYDNIAGKIKLLAKISCIVEAAASIITGIVLMAADNDFVLIGLALMLVAPAVAWALSWLLYGFGEIVDKLGDIERNTRGGEKKSKAQTKADNTRIREIEKLRAQGLISEEEYQQAISKNK